MRAKLNLSIFKYSEKIPVYNSEAEVLKIFRILLKNFKISLLITENASVSVYLSIRLGSYSRVIFFQIGISSLIEALNTLQLYIGKHAQN